MPWYTAKKQNSGRRKQSTERAPIPPPRGYRYAALATKSCGALAQSPPPPTRSNRGRSQGLDAGISAAAQVHGRYHVITMYNPQTPFIRLHVPFRKECCEIGHVCFGCASCLLLPLLFPSSHTSSFLSAEEGGAQNVAQTCRWRFIIPRLRLAPPVPYTL